MSTPPHNPVADLRGASRLVFEATSGVTDLVEAMHGTIAGLAGLVPGSSTQRTRGLTGFVYRCVGASMRLVGHGLDAALAPLARRSGTRASPPGRDAALAVLNGVLGDHLAASGNPLAITMSLRRDASVLHPDCHAIRAAIPAVTGRVLIQAHGLCMNDRQWARSGRDHVAAIAQELGYTSMHLHYNSGLRIAANGRQFAGLLERLATRWPVLLEELVIVGHSMGGLVARSAHHHGKAASHAWPARLRKLVFLGTPHHGAPLERAGNGLDMLLGLSPYTRPFTRLGRIRSAGITDLRFGCLLDEDWQGRERYAPQRKDMRTPLPLPAGVECYAVAAVRAEQGDAPAARLFGDGLVPVASALGEHEDTRFALRFPASHRWVGERLSHLDLLSSPRVFDQVGRWLER
ncbi:esterase/lipase family protein [Piscinibacter sp.]|uniref:esterase/lipase family protein n=1 Tax=Piscinibacter sp. TaxID=1903157 RepID=UPI002C28A7E9|nr:alpha/beta hydrolase [Albitalea sp.]HUG26609.1 alpha/beta hydrolase [Albitalea sp.]